MTKTETIKYHTQYSELGKRCIVHNSLTKNKSILEDVNENWKECDLLTYSPSVESGVDFNIVGHFDKCYAVLESRSTSYRAFCQMLNRVRHYKENNIICLMPLKMRYKLDDVLIRYDEVKLQKYKGIEITNLVNILLHNDVERYNSKNYFISSLCNMLDKKGHTYEEIKKEEIYDILTEEENQILNSNVIKHLYENGTPYQINTIGAIIENAEPVRLLQQLREIYRSEVLESINMINGERRYVKGKDEIVKAILGSKTLTDIEFNLLLNKQQTNQQITDDELLSINKILYKKVFKFIDISDMTFTKLKTIYNNIDNMKNYEYLLFNSKSTNIIEGLVKDDNDILGKMEMTKLTYLNNLLQNLGFQFKLDKLKRIESITEEVQMTKFEEYKEMVIEFVKKHKTLYNCERTLKTINWMKCLNDILDIYGLECDKIERKISVGNSRVSKYVLSMTKKNFLDIYVENYYKYYTNEIKNLPPSIIINIVEDEFRNLERADLKKYYKKLKEEN